MARIRSIKPEFWSSEQVVECSINARMLFIGIWTFCDDGGAIPAAPKQLKMKIYPGDDYLSSDIQRLLDELLANNLILVYEIDNTKYIKVLGWDKHQKIDRPSYKFPQISGFIPKNKNEYLQMVAEYSASIRQLNDERHPPDGMGVEGSGGDGSSSYQREIVSLVDNLEGEL